jgi:hypothetical protein
VLSGLSEGGKVLGLILNETTQGLLARVMSLRHWRAVVRGGGYHHHLCSHHLQHHHHQHDRHHHQGGEGQGGEGACPGP